jgi:hypothetical protein
MFGGESESDEGIAPLAGDGLLQRDLASPVRRPDAVPVELTREQIQAAIAYNKRQFDDPAQIELLRDVLGVGVGSEVDEDFVRGVVSFQAVSDLDQDGKVGPRTAIRLSRETRAEAALLPPGDRRSLTRLGRTLNADSITISVVNAAHELTQTGSSEFGVRWGVPDPTANGWIIQHVQFAGAKTDCGGAPVAMNNPALEYWEAWQVRAGNVFVGGTAGAHQADTFRTADEGPGTRGNVSITGRVTFMPSFNLTQPPWGHAVPAAGALPTRLTAPAGWSDGQPRHHRMAVTWNDCVVPRTHGLASTP